MAGHAAVVLCEDKECLRTLQASLAAMMPVLPAPPADGAWLLVCDSAQAGHEYALPPCRTIRLGVSDAHAHDDASVETVALPVRLSSLLARIGQSAFAPTPERLVEGGAVYFHSVRRELIHEASRQTVGLTEKEARLLQALMQADGASVSRQQLLADVWEYQPEVKSRTLETHLSRLRTKLQQFAHGGAEVLLEDGGYRLAAVR